MTHKHFQLIANALKDTRPSDHLQNYGVMKAQWERDVIMIAESLQQTNPRFDVHKFIDWCKK